MRVSELVERMAHKYDLPEGAISAILYEIEGLDAEDLSEIVETLKSGQSFASMTLGFYPEAYDVLLGVPYYDGRYWGHGVRVKKAVFYALYEELMPIFIEAGPCDWLDWSDYAKEDYFWKPTFRV